MAPRFAKTASWLRKLRQHKQNIPPAVIANAINVNEIDYSRTTPQYAATAYLAHLLLRDTKPNAHAKAKEPNADAQLD